MQRTLARPVEHHPQSVQRVLESHGPLRRDGAIARNRLQQRHVVDGRQSRRIRFRLRLSRNPRRRRLPQGQARIEDRGGRGARMPDHALQRLRRPQHPGHRRQAHPADPQRHEHRPGGCHQRPTRPTCLDVMPSTPRPASGSLAEPGRRRRNSCRDAGRHRATRRSATPWPPSPRPRRWNLTSDDVDRDRGHRRFSELYNSEREKHHVDPLRRRLRRHRMLHEAVIRRAP